MKEHITLEGNKEKVREHYDLVSPYYKSLWGQHIHHGYWQSGKETKEEAQENLTKLLVDTAHIKSGSRILDVGCGVGGSSIFLAKNLNASVVGITISPIQAEMARELATQAGVTVDFQVMDAEDMDIKDSFDVVWSIEALSHLNDQRLFFKKAAERLVPGGKFAIIDWFKKENLTPEQEDKFIQPIKSGMLTPHMTTMEDYKMFIEEAGLKVVEFKDISSNVSKTWDICLDIIKNPALWKLALVHGKEFVEFLKAFMAMRDGFASKTFAYGIIVAEKQS